MGLLSAFMQNKKDTNGQRKKLTGFWHSYAAGKNRQLNDMFFVLKSNKKVFKSCWTAKLRPQETLHQKKN